LKATKVIIPYNGKKELKKHYVDSEKYRKQYGRLAKSMEKEDGYDEETEGIIEIAVQKTEEMEVSGSCHLSC